MSSSTKKKKGTTKASAGSTSAPAWVLAPESFTCPDSSLSSSSILVPAESSTFSDSYIVDLDHDDKTLHTALRLSDDPTRGIGRWPRSVLDNSIFVHSSALSVMGVGKGDLVLVQNPDNGRKAVLRAWPANSVQGIPTDLATASHRVGGCLQASSEETGFCQVSVAKFDITPLPAKSVRLKYSFSESDAQIANSSRSVLDSLAATALSDCVAIHQGSLLLVNYYGQSVTVEVDDVVPHGGRIPSRDNAHDVTSPRGRLGEVNELADKFKGLLNSPIVTSTPTKAPSSTSERDLSENDSKGYFIPTASTLVEFVHTDGSDSNEDENVESSQSKPMVGGLDKELKVIGEAVSAGLQCNPYVGVLLYGPSGTGKSTLARSLPAAFGWQCEELNGAEVFSKFSGETEANVRSTFAKVRQMASSSSAPVMLFIDELDVLCGSGNKEKVSDQERRVSATLRSLIDGFSSSKSTGHPPTSNGRVVLVAATNRPSAIDPSFRRPGRLDVEVEIGVPDANARLDILTKAMSSFGGEVEGEVTEAALDRVSKAAHGYVGADLHALCGQALASMDLGHNSMDSALEAALKVVKPSAMREIQVEVPNVTWDDIGGMEDLKLKLKQAVEWPIKHADMFAKMGVTAPKGVLMYGPPGCSKTMIAKALANESKLNFVAIKGPELFSKWVGESEQAVRDLFHRARRVAPSIVFFDEIDALGGERGGSGGGGGGKVGDRVLAQMLTEMDGIEALADVTVVAATNRPDMIDKALMRPGRLDRIVYVPLPDQPTRHKILNVHTRKKPVDDDVNLDQLASETEGYSGAELAAVCNEAAMKALEDAIGAGLDSASEPRINSGHFEAALKAVTPRIDHKLLKVYEEFQQRGKTG